MLRCKFAFAELLLHDFVLKFKPGVIQVSFHPEDEIFFLLMLQGEVSKLFCS